jgi:hypothetical protein
MKMTAKDRETSGGRSISRQIQMRAAHCYQNLTQHHYDFIVYYGEIIALLRIGKSDGSSDHGIERSGSQKPRNC